MRIFLTIGLVLFLFMGAQAQIHLRYNPDNQQVRQAEAEAQRVLQEEYELFSGRPWQGALEKNDCPNLDPDVFYVTPDVPLGTFVDTIAFGGGDGTTLELADCSGQPLQFGTVSLINVTLMYTPNVGVEAGIDSVCVDLCQADNSCQTFKYTFVVRRRGQTHIEDPVFLQAEEFIPEVCVDETQLPGALACNKFVECLDDYDGEGRQVYYFNTYSEPTPCIRYGATRFAGIDTMCVVLCDEFTICDTFKIPFVIQSDTLGLPFFDDFSAPGPYPSADYWLDRDGFVNTTLADDPPSVGLVTLDGLDRGGAPYPLIGAADALTSKYIDLSNPAGPVFLKFFVAPKGLGLLPNEPDSLVLQFRNNQREWKTVRTFAGFDQPIPIDQSPPFEFQAVAIDQQEFLYNGFQFRFVNYATPVGIYDLWHIDYVRISDVEGDQSFFSDLTFTQLPPTMLTNYSSMPYSHFKDFANSELRSSPLPSSYYNHLNTGQNPSTNSRITFKELIFDENFPVNLNVTDASNLAPQVHTDYEKDLGDEFAVIANKLANDFGSSGKLLFQTQYDFDNPNEIVQNDTVRRITVFDNYFAYDDGSAESYLFFDNPQSDNPKLAVRFRSNIDDSLRAVQFHFPHVNGNAEDQLFNIQVFVNDLNAEPAYEAFFKQPLYTDSVRDTLQGFTTYRLENVLKELTPVFLPAGSEFYVVFQQVTTTNDGIPIGFDLNNDFSKNVFVNLGDGNWSSIPDNFVGSPLVRAVVGEITPVNTATKEVSSIVEKLVAFSPNPGNGLFQVHPLTSTNAQYQYEVYQSTGQKMESGVLANQLDLQQYPNGLYYLRVWSEQGQAVETHTLVILK